LSDNLLNNMKIEATCETVSLSSLLIFLSASSISSQIPPSCNPLLISSLTYFFQVFLALIFSFPFPSSSSSSSSSSL
jgi:hypothetical protein